jgi:hypothetical protein
MTQPLNYCRQVVQRNTDIVRDARRFPERIVAEAASTIDLLTQAQKFILPTGGLFFYDSDLRGLDSEMELRLPYPVVALEYSMQAPDACAHAAAKGEVWWHGEMSKSFSKAIVVAREWDRDIAVGVMYADRANGCWGVLTPPVIVPKLGAIDHTRRGVGGKPLLMFQHSLAPDIQEGGVRAVAAMDTVADSGMPVSVYTDPLWRVLSFLNVLACTNVHTTRIVPKDKKRVVKTAFPFDTYHVLEVDASKSAVAGAARGRTGRSPREHLRRGHIRRCDSGIKTWVNSCVVAAGSIGKVTKDYAIRRTA